MKELAQSLLSAQDANVLVVDWVYGASFAYNLVVENYREVALQISVLINQLQARQMLHRAVIFRDASALLPCVLTMAVSPNRNTDAR